MTACEQCTAPGQWCGNGIPGTGPQPCVVCQQPTYARSACGAPRCLSDHLRITARAPEPTIQKPTNVITLPVPTADVGGVAPLRLLQLLERDHPPLRRFNGAMREPYWRPELPGITWAAHVIVGYSWRRAYQDPIMVLDRNAAFLSAASSVLVAHGRLDHTGPMAEYDPKQAGYYRIQVFPWPHRDMPHPLGKPRTDEIWVPGPTVQLLGRLVDAGRWPDITILDSYTSPGVRLTTWTNVVRDIRTGILEKFGKESEEYAEFKVSFGHVFGLLQGHQEPGKERTWKCRAHRPDWAHTIMAQASATLWNAADKCLFVAGIPPVSLTNTDELAIPASCFDAVTDGESPAIRIDNSGIRLGTFKVKGGPDREQD